MKTKLKILILADEVWNDEIFGNNVLTNWFEGVSADFAEVYCGPGFPKNNCCSKYFQVTDLMMVKSFFGIKAGVTFVSDENVSTKKYDNQHSKLYKFLKLISGEWLRLVRDFIWQFGIYNERSLEKFINDFEPDLIFSTRLLTPKLMRLEKIISKLTKAPIIAFTGDDEISLQHWQWSPLFWFRRLLFRFFFKKHIKIYKHYFMFSEEQAIEYHKKFNISTSVISKCCDVNKKNIRTSVNFPIRMVYAGRFYCNRWKTLLKISEAIKKINANGVKIVFSIYSMDDMPRKLKNIVNSVSFIEYNGIVKPAELNKIYQTTDIALHVESFDNKFKYTTRYSLSTKIVDLLGTGCAIVAICWSGQTGFKYLKKSDCAICIDKVEKIYDQLKIIVDNNDIILNLSKKSINFASNNLNRQIVQGEIMDKFSEIVNEYKK